MTNRSKAMTIGLSCVLTAAVALSTSAALGGQSPMVPSTPTPTVRGGGAPKKAPADDGPVRDSRDAVIGFTKTAEIPGTPWRIHDAARPQPPAITPGATAGAASSDAIVLFDGKDLSKWSHVQQGQPVDAKWAVRDGYFEVTPGAGGALWTREKFGDVQLHLEFMSPASGRGASQNRGNSGVKFMGLYEVQILDSYDNLTYADGMSGSIYGEHPPLVNAARKPGEWQTYDIVFEAPKFSGQALVTPAYVTLFWNGVLVQHRAQILGNTSPTMAAHAYAPHDAEMAFHIQDHQHPVRYRNIWVRKLALP
jgi:hypothetical protein